MRLFIFADKMIPELKEKSNVLQESLPTALKGINQFPAEVAENRLGAILSLIGIIQRFKCGISVWSEDGRCLDTEFF